jgi:hypothetical protein
VTRPATRHEHPVTTPTEVDNEEVQNLSRAIVDAQLRPATTVLRRDALAAASTQDRRHDGCNADGKEPASENLHDQIMAQITAAARNIDQQGLVLRIPPRGV